MGIEGSNPSLTATYIMFAKLDVFNKTTDSLQRLKIG